MGDEPERGAATGGSRKAGSAPRLRKRRKEARPSEIIEAALELFSEHGFGATRMEDVARRAGVAKGTLFVYFPTKDDLFRAVARTITAINIERLQLAAANLDRPVTELVPALLGQAALLGETHVPGMLRLLISESRLFPDLARVWHDEVVSTVLGLLTTAISRAQARGEVRPGDPRLFAFSIIGPMISGLLFREIFGGSGAPVPDLQKLAAQHSETILHSILTAPGAREDRT